MAIFDVSFNKAMRLEGGFVNDPNDPGGATKYGISLRLLASLDTKLNGHAEGDLNGDGVINVKDVKDLTPDQAATIYKSKWWDKYGYGQLTQALADKLFCTAINMGAIPAHKLLQRALAANGQAIVDDGVLGPDTLQAIRFVISRVGEPALVNCYRSEQAGYYRHLVAVNPKLGKFLNGWLNRAYDRAA